MARRILVVEDEPAIADSVVYALNTEGFETVWCTTARDASAALAEGGIDLVVLDVGLPDRNGFDLCRDIRKTSSLPIIFLTARKEEVDRVVGLEIGGDDYIVKPFSPREVSARVKAVLRRSAPGEGEPAAGKGVSPAFRVDAAKCAVAYHGVPLNLSRYEYRILCMLLERPGWVFSREQIMERVWEEPEASLDRTVDTHIKTLRMKLHAVRPKLDPIQTHRGLGYSLREKP